MWGPFVMPGPRAYQDDERGREKMRDTMRGLRPTWTMDTRREARAGLADARRTPGARPWWGRRYGDVSYAVGYAVGSVLR